MGMNTTAIILAQPITIREECRIPGHPKGSTAACELESAQAVDGESVKARIFAELSSTIEYTRRAEERQDETHWT